MLATVMHDLIIDDLAQIDIDRSAAWYRQFGSRLSRRFLQEVRSKISVIIENPFLYPILYRSIRQTVLHKFPYSLHYIILDDRIKVIACLHNARNREQILEERR